VVNLLSDKRPAEPFPPLDDDQRARIEQRVRVLSRLDWPDCARDLARAVAGVSAELEELENEPTPVVAQDLLACVARARHSLLDASSGPSAGTPGSPPLGGEWLCYWPGRSLSTGEAEIASRGFFDVRDRPPLGLWVEALGRRRGRSLEAFELAILCWVPPSAVRSARAGRDACASGSLTNLADISDLLNEQVLSIR
jgi:hypothetical protein